MNKITQEAKKAGYTRIYSDFIYAAKRLGLCEKEVKTKKSFRTGISNGRYYP